MYLKTAAEIREDWYRRGLKASDWAKDNDVRARTVTDLLSGKAKGRWGDAHRAAVLLGLKDGVIECREK